MSGTDKLARRFKAVPADFIWDELVRLLESKGYGEEKGKGARRKFKGKNLPTINLHEPHPGKIVKRYALRYVHETLESEGLI
jgi:predicted RNA binding protein YcfA (HicA-like mRNA interferase family)